MYINKDDLEAVDGFFAFSSDYYWSSTEIGDYYAWYQDFNFGDQNGFSKTNTVSVRAVRAF